MITIEFKCQKHPKYKAIRRPKCCHHCIELYGIKQRLGYRWKHPGWTVATVTLTRGTRSRLSRT